MPNSSIRTALGRAAEAFDLITTERGWGGPPLLLRTRGGVDPADGAELAVRPLDGHPGQALLGFSAPMGWTAIGVSSEGWAGPYHGEVTGYSAVASPGARRRVRAIVLIDRDGSLAGCARWRDGGIVAEAPTDGFVVDCLRRALGLRTPPPTTTTDTLFAALWLEGIVAGGRRGCQTMTWRQVAHLHPAVHLLVQNGQEVPADLVETAQAFGRACDWTMVRHQLIRGWKLGVEASVAVWMDTGMLSRWMVEQMRPVAELLTRARRRCSPAAFRQLVHALDDLGVATGGIGGLARQPPG